MKFQVGDKVRLIRNKNNINWHWCRGREDVYGTVEKAHQRASLEDEPLSDNWYSVRFDDYNHYTDNFHIVDEDDLEICCDR